ncbi:MULTISPECIES: dipeptidase PepV [Bacillaceae]|uniref:Dipeptidase PepV n=1 Tax=Evansella alkalicola TaxID=745819 RepID=A0ABS6JR80_9BACI|nr:MULTISPECIES: dipeptidase PepV [Bacillaceae]MBU9721063.1 dipeptidase PepV [Bacillus alkalicola]
MNWQEQVENIQQKLIEDTQAFLQIKSVLDTSTVKEGAPFGEGIREAYDWILEKAANDGFTIKDVDGYGAHIEMGEGSEIVGILCHVDVVPAGGGWTTPPYSAKIREGKIFARGAIDDKGPTMAAYYAMKIIKDQHLQLGKRVRLIIGTDEESEWRCVKHYFEHEEMPNVGFAPDADFPIINAEKGICDLEFSTYISADGGIVESFHAGERLNMVPEKASATLSGIDINDIRDRFLHFLSEHSVSGEFHVENDKITLEVSGKSAHGMEPDKGINSGLYLANFISTLPLQGNEVDYFKTLSDLFFLDSRGKKIGIDYKDDMKGDVTLNLGVLNCKKGGEGKIGVNLRYPDGANYPSIYEKLKNSMENRHFTTHIITHEKPHAVSEDHPLVKTLAKVYEEQTGEKAETLAIGGGTYARSLEAGVAFGPMFPGQLDVAHQSDEYISIDNLKKATSIYAQAIYELAKK